MRISINLNNHPQLKGTPQTFAKTIIEEALKTFLETEQGRAMCSVFKAEEAKVVHKPGVVAEEAVTPSIINETKLIIDDDDDMLGGFGQ